MPLTPVPILARVLPRDEIHRSKRAITRSTARTASSQIHHGCAGRGGPW